MPGLNLLKTPFKLLRRTEPATPAWFNVYNPDWYKKLGKGRLAIRNYLAALDPRRDYQEIAFISTAYEFPFDTMRSLEVALLRTFCVPRTSAILEQTGEFVFRPQKRYDDTVLILNEILEWGFESERGRAALRRMNHMHHAYPIQNDEFLYVLSTFIFEPIRWNRRFGWRSLTESERLASYYYWEALARRMAIKDIPGSYEEFERYNIEYEDTYFIYSKANQIIGEATRDLFLSWFPAFLRPLVKKGVYAMLDERTLAAFGFPKASPLVYKLIAMALQVRRFILRHLPPRRHPHLLTRARWRSYPSGYTIDQLGTYPQKVNSKS